MLILGVDPGTRILGYSLLQTDPKPQMVLMDVLYLKNMEDYNLRIRTVFDSMCSVIDQYHPSHLSIEAPFFGKNVQSMLKLGRAQGVTIAAAMSRNMTFSEYEPATIKQYITGSGGATKEQVLAMLQAHLGVDLQPRYLDATDALAAAYCHYLVSTNPMADIRAQLRPAKQRKAKNASWSDYVKQNPDVVSRD
ncbi:MAG: crossover junction endodeoxyribonuclease RuvC [Bacteroidales bacterium]|nr:crossover junction endodeoxyribonuclease RuvC [Candidatus Colimorpha onthohippi]